MVSRSPSRFSAATVASTPGTSPTPITSALGLVERSRRASVSGTFEWRARVSLSGMREVRAVVRRPGEDRPLAWVEHSLARACPLATTGPNDRTLPLIGVGVSSLTLGVLVLIAFAYHGRHVTVGGRHLAAPYRR